MSFRLTYATMFDPPEEMHAHFDAALARLEAGLGQRHSLFVAGLDREPADWTTRHSPIDTDLVLGAFRQVRLRNREWRDQIEQVYTLFPRLKERRAQLAGTLSGGERQMLAVGRALMSRPTLLMLDEPSLGLAPLVVQEIFRTVSALRATGVTILLVEQNARAALEVADHGYVLEMGSVSAEGEARQLAGDSRVIDTYLGAARA